jgi:hypothetical protein
MATTQRRSRHQLTDAALEMLAQHGDDPYPEVDTSDEQLPFGDIIDAEHPPHCLHIA